MPKSYIFCYTLLLAILFTGSVSCSKKTVETAQELVFSTTELRLTGKGENKSIHLKSTTDWQLSTAANWLQLTPSKGAAGTVKIEVEAPENPSTQPREAIVEAVAGNLRESFKVVQTGASQLTVSNDAFQVDAEGGQILLEIKSSGAYKVDVEQPWIQQLDQTAEGTLSFAISPYSGLSERSGGITIRLDDLHQTVTVTQRGAAITLPSDQSGMPSNAVELAKKISIGWNLGNSLEAASSPSVANETLWGNPKTTKPLIDAVKAAGFNAVRIPCAWSGYIVDAETYKISDVWLDRVKEVVDYCIANEMYAIVNIHWDGGWLENNPVYAKQAEVNEKQKALWDQIARHFRNYDEKLLFAGTNEVHADYNEPTSENIAVQLSFNQTFVDAVRATGGRNTWRTLVVQAYNTNIDLAVKYLTMPNDLTDNRLMAEVHYYDPWDFCGDEKSNKYVWGNAFKNHPNNSSWGQEDWVTAAFNKMKVEFVDKGIPVILGEYGAILRTTLGPAYDDHKKARNHYLQYVTKTARDKGLIPFYWDNGDTGNNGFGLFDRRTFQQVHPDAILAITKP